MKSNLITTYFFSAFVLFSPLLQRTSVEPEPLGSMFSKSYWIDFYHFFIIGSVENAYYDVFNTSY